MHVGRAAAGHESRDGRSGSGRRGRRDGGHAALAVRHGQHERRRLGARGRLRHRVVGAGPAGQHRLHPHRRPRAQSAGACRVDPEAQVAFSCFLLMVATGGSRRLSAVAGFRENINHQSQLIQNP